MGGLAHAEKRGPLLKKVKRVLYSAGVASSFFGKRDKVGDGEWGAHRSMRSLICGSDGDGGDIRDPHRTTLVIVNEAAHDGDIEVVGRVAVLLLLPLVLASLAARSCRARVAPDFEQRYQRASERANDACIVGSCPKWSRNK